MVKNNQNARDCKPEAWEKLERCDITLAIVKSGKNDRISISGNGYENHFCLYLTQSMEGIM